MTTSVLCKEMLRPSEGTSLGLNVACVLFLAQLGRVWGESALPQTEVRLSLLRGIDRGRGNRESEDCSQRRCGMSMSYTSEWSPFYLVIAPIMERKTDSAP